MISADQTSAANLHAINAFCTYVEQNNSPMDKNKKLTLEEFREGNMETKKIIHLNFLKLRDNGAALLARIQAPQLRILRLWGCQIGHNGLKSVLGMLKQPLDTLYLGQNPFGVAGIQLIAAHPKLRNLRDLRFEQNSLGHEGMEALVAKDWPNLECLYIGKNKICDEGLARLMTANMPKLKELNLILNDISPDGFEQLKASEFLSKIAVFEFLEKDKNGNKIISYSTKPGSKKK